MWPLLWWKSNKCYVLRVCVCSLSYPAWIVHAPYCHLWPAQLYLIFPDYLIKCDFRKKLLNPKCVFWFPLQILSEAFLILRRNERDMMKNVYWSLCKVPVILVRFQWMVTFLEIFSKNIEISNFTKIRPVAAELFHADGRTDEQINGWKGGQTDERTNRPTERQKDMTKLIVIFGNLANTPKNTRIFCGPTRRRISFQAKSGCSII